MTKPNHTIVLNKNARRNFSLNETFQAGIALEGWEVKSLRMGKVDAKDTTITAMYISKINPDSKPRRSATGKESVVSKI